MPNLSRNELINDGLILHQNSEQLINYIQEGILTEKDLDNEGVLHEIKKIVKDGLLERNKNEEDLYQKCLKEQDFTPYKLQFPNGKHLESIIKFENNSAEIELFNSCKATNQFEEYLIKYPNGKYLREIQEIQEDVLYQTCLNREDFSDYNQKYPNGKFLGSIKNWEEKNGERKEIIQKLSKDQNAYDLTILKDKIETGIISNQDIKNLPVFSHLPNLSEFKLYDLFTGENPTEIPQDINEIYFWGVPGSGKTTAISSILSYGVNKKGIFSLLTGSNGYNQALQLSNIFFHTDVAVLPRPTAHESNVLIPVNFFKDGDALKQEIKASFFDLSGELFQEFLVYVDNPNPKYSDIFQNFNELINSSNIKHHFFFVDYQYNQRSNQSNSNVLGFSQNNYLDAALRYFENNGTFSERTNSIYIVVTKIEASGRPKEEWDEVAQQYIKENCFALYKGLNDICVSTNINGGEIKILPFSIGEVFLRKLCIADFTSAGRIIDEIKTIIRPKKGGLFKFFTSKN